MLVDVELRNRLLQRGLSSAGRLQKQISVNAERVFTRGADEIQPRVHGGMMMMSTFRKIMCTFRAQAAEILRSAHPKP